VRERRGRPRVLVAFGLLTIPCLLFADAVFRGRVFYERDLQLDWYTQMEAFVRSVAHGSWPVWDDTIAFGQPLLADPSAQILYPPTWLNLLMQPWRYYTVFVVGHVILAGVGLYLLTRRLGASSLASFLGAAVWMSSGPLVSMANTWQHFAGAAWVPWVLLAAQRALDSGRFSSATVWGVTAGAQVFSGSADVCAMTAVLVVLLVAMRVVPPGPTVGSGVALRQTVLAFAVASLLSAAVWVPALDVARGSSRWDYPSDVRAAWSLGPGDVAGVVVPGRADAPEVPLLASVYLGLPALLVGAAAFQGPSRRFALFLLAAGAASLAYAMGPFTPFYDLVLTLAPPFRLFRYPSKALVFTAFAWSGLCGLGLDAWGRRAPWGRLRAAATAAPPVLAAVWCLWLPPRHTDTARAALLTLLAGALLWAARRRRGEASRPWLAATVVLATADLVVQHHGLNRTTSADLVAFRPPVVDAVKENDHRRLFVYDYMALGSSQRHLHRDDPYMVVLPPPGWTLERWRVLSQRLYPFPPVAGRFGLEGSYDLDLRGLYPRSLSSLVDLAYRVAGTPPFLRLLRLGAVSHVVALHADGFEELRPLATLTSPFPEPIRVFRVPDPLPRTYVVAGVRIADGSAARAALLSPEFRPEEELVLPADSGIRPAPPASAGRSRIVERRPDRVRVEAELERPGYVVLVDSYDPGWIASADGRPATLLRANVAFRAVPVGAGRHVLELVYRPRAVYVGFCLTAACLLGLMAPGWMRRRR
jgi:hypothetical protein